MDTDFYRVETIGMVMDENMELCVPNVIGKKSSFSNENVSYGSMPMFAYRDNDVLRDIITDDVIKFDSNFVLPEGLSVSKSLRSSDIDLVAMDVEPVEVRSMFGFIFELDNDDIERYIAEVNRLKVICNKRYKLRDRVNSTNEDEYIRKLMIDNISFFKNNCRHIMNEVSLENKFVRKKKC